MLLPSILTAILAKSQANKEKQTSANLNTNIPNLSNVDEIKEEQVLEQVSEPVQVLEQVLEPVSTQQYMNAVLMQNRRIRQQKQQQQQQQILNTIAAVNQANAARPRNSNPFRQMKI